MSPTFRNPPDTQSTSTPSSTDWSCTACPSRCDTATWHRPRALTRGGIFAALVFAAEAFPPANEFGPRAFTQDQLHDTVGKYLTVDEIRPARSWINVPKTLPDGFEYRNVVIGSDGRAQLPSWLVVAHRS